MVSREEWQRLTNGSVDPNGWGVPHNTAANRATNAEKSTGEIISQIESRNAQGKPTWQLRHELESRISHDE